MSAAAIELHRVTKRFGGRPAVQELSFSVSAGEIAGLLGSARRARAGGGGPVCRRRSRR